MFTIPVMASSISQINVTEPCDKNGAYGESLRHSLGANVKPSLPVPNGCARKRAMRKAYHNLQRGVAEGIREKIGRASCRERVLVAV